MLNLKHIGKRILYRPLTFGMIWLLLTTFFFEFGPYDFGIQNKTIMYMYLFFVYFAIWIGYRSGIRSGSKDLKLKFNPFILLHLALFIAIWKTLFDYVLGIQSLMPLATSLKDPYLARAMENNRPADYLQIFLMPFTFLLLPFATYYWKKLNASTKVLSLIIILQSILNSIGTATRAGLLTLIFFIGSPFLVQYYRQYPRANNRFRTWIILALILGIFFSYTNFISVKRTGVDISYDNRLAARTDAPFNFDNIFYKITPTSIKPVVMEGIYYYTHGYRALALALDKPFTGSTLGFGHSRFLTRNISRLTNTDFFLRNSYFFRLNKEDNVPITKWITAYPWIASDVTFPGSLLIMFFFGKILAQTWLDSLTGNNPIALGLFTLLNYQFFSLPQGTIVQDGPYLLTFYLFLIIWLFTRTKGCPGINLFSE